MCYLCFLWFLFSVPLLCLLWLILCWLAENHGHVRRSARAHDVERIQRGEESAAEDHPQTGLYEAVIRGKESIAETARKKSKEQGMKAPDPELAVR